MPDEARPQVDAAMYARVFEGHAEGVLILEDLAKRFARGSTLTGGIDAILKTYHAGGQRSVVEFIVNRCNEANGLAPNAD